MKSVLKTLGVCFIALIVVVGLTLLVMNRHVDTTQAQSTYKTNSDHLKEQLETKYDTTFSSAQIRELNCESRQVINSMSSPAPRYRIQTDCFTDNAQLTADKGETFGSTLYTKDNGETVAATLIADQNGKPSLVQNNEEGNSYAQKIQKLQASLEKENNIKLSNEQMSELNCRVIYDSSSGSTHCYTASDLQSANGYGTTVINVNDHKYKVHLISAGFGRYELNVVDGKN